MTGLGTLHHDVHVQEPVVAELIFGRGCDYTQQEARATAVYQHGQQAGASPQTAAQAILRIIRTPAPARYCLAGREKWYARLGRILPPSAMESLAGRHFQVPSKPQAKPEPVPSAT